MVTKTRPNPAYEEFVKSKKAFQEVVDQCLTARAAGGEK
jgi:hypothetical protein